MTAFVLGLSVAAGAMAWHFGFTRGVRIGKALEQEDAKAKMLPDSRCTCATMIGCTWNGAPLPDVVHECAACAEKRALAEFCAMLGDREVPE